MHFSKTKKFIDRATSLFMPLMGHEQFVLITLGAITGFLVACGGLGFSYLVSQTAQWCFPMSGAAEVVHSVTAAAQNLPFWWILFLPSVGGLIVGLIVTRAASEAKGHGIPEVIQAQALKGGKIRKRVAIVKILASAITIGTGGSAGKEGPVVQIGAACGSAFGQVLKLSRARVRTLVGCGAAAGIATVFNAPIAGVIFSAEIIMGSFEASSFASLVVCAVIATVTSRAFVGNVALLKIPFLKHQMESPWEVLTYLGLGIAAAVVAISYVRWLYGTEDLFARLKKIPDWGKPAIGGFIVGIIGIAYPQILSQGFDTLTSVLASVDQLPMEWWVILLLLFFKMVATSLTIGSGGSGGVFAPSLFIGAMLGGVYGYWVHNLFPEVTAGPGAYALVGMGAVVAGVTAAPISSILILFEMTDDYKIILPLMLSVIISTVISSQFLKASIYTLKLKRRGIVLHAGRDQSIMQGLFVGETMRKKFKTVPENTRFRQLLQIVTQSPQTTFPVVDAKKDYLGTITFEMLKEFLLDQEGGDVLIARDLMVEHATFLYPDDSLLIAMDRFSSTDLAELPVVDPKNPKILLGLISRSDVLKQYHRGLRERSSAAV